MTRERRTVGVLCTLGVNSLEQRCPIELPVAEMLYSDTVQDSSLQPRVAFEHLKCS